MNPVCFLIQNYFSVWHCGDTSCPAISSPDVKWICYYNPNTRILFAPWFKTALQNYFVVILHVLPFQVQMSNESLVTIPTHESCSLFDSKLLFSMTLWCWFMSWTFKCRCQIEPLVTIPTHETCLLFDSKLLFSMTLWWYFMSCHYKSRCQMNLLLQSQHTNPVCSLIQNCSAKLLCCDTSCPDISSPDVKWISCYNPNRRILFALWF